MEKPLGDFTPHRTSRLGVLARCKACCAELERDRNKDAARRAAKAAKQRARRMDPETADRDRATSRAWKRRNPERVQAMNSAPEKVASNLAWNRRNPDRRSESAKRYQRRNPEISKISQARRRARKLATDSALTQAEWLAILDDFGQSCAYCLRTGVPLQQEHMTPLSRGGSHDRANVVPACGPCNYKKHTRTILEFLTIGGRASWPSP
ncbi:MAG TPA: HNH endonuclease [Phytomonospora sp.]